MRRTLSTIGLAGAAFTVLLLVQSASGEPIGSPGIKFSDTLRPFVGQKCTATQDAGPVRLHFKGKGDFELVQVGDDFVKLAKSGFSRLVPISSLQVYVTK